MPEGTVAGGATTAGAATTLDVDAEAAEDARHHRPAPTTTTAKRETAAPEFQRIRHAEIVGP